MIAGTVNANLEATVPLVVVGTRSRRQQVEAVIDTGFTGYLTLPPSIIATLQLTWLGREQGILADGSVDNFDVYRGAVIWDGQPRAIEVEAVNAEPLVGMTLLERHSLRIDVVSGGTVSINSLP
ncbi:MAG: clan AA aspartic protease [Planctomycetes bacterium]|nr:clan AA aspartic protease [Planctomycetota bacterium]MBL7040331.1 clan AA aspartic protease [Pirellulaceae bacterium]